MVLLLLLSGSVVQAQDQVEQFAQDMLKIADNFAAPAAESSAYLSGAGWFTGAKVLDLWEVDLSVQGNVLLVPEKKKSVVINNFELLRVKGGGVAEIPTAFGGNTDLVFEGEILTQSFEFDAIDGVNKQALAHPFVQASVGLPFGTELTARFLPSTEIDGVQFSTYGVGLKHNFSQYSLNPQPYDFQFAALLAYSKYDVNYAFEPVTIPHDIPTWSPESTLKDIDVDGNFFLLQLLTSKSLGTNGWSAFGAVGLTSFTFDYIMGGQGELLPIINSKLETLSNNELDVKGDIGVTYEKGDFLISSMFTQGKYSNLNISLHYRL